MNAMHVGLIYIFECQLIWAGSATI